MLGIVGLLGRRDAVGRGRAERERLGAVEVARAEAGRARRGADGEQGGEDGDVDRVEDELAVVGFFVLVFVSPLRRDERKGEKEGTKRRDRRSGSGLKRKERSSTSEENPSDEQKMQRERETLRSLPRFFLLLVPTLSQMLLCNVLCD